MPDPSWTSLLPPLLAIGLAIGTRQVYGSLAGGIWLGTTQLAGGNPLTGLADAIGACVGVLTDAGNARVLLFTLVIGALIRTVEVTGGVAGFVAWVEARPWARGPRAARLLAWLTGVVIFVESNITVLVAGSVARPLFDRQGEPRTLLAYLIDATSAAVCVLIPLNAWGAYVLALLDEQGVPDPLATFIASVPLNLYALVTVLLAGVVAWTGWRIGPMRRAAPAPAEEVQAELSGPKPWAGQMLLPILTMVAAMPLSLWVTGEGDVLAGSGSTSVLWAVLAGLAVAWVMAWARRVRPAEGLVKTGLTGAGSMLGMALVLLLALALGAVTRELGTGAYVAGVVSAVDAWALLPLVFGVGAFVAFSTGTSWGTFAIMVPIAVPAAAALGLPVAPFLAAALSGGIFGDHASPISDTTVVSSLAAGTDHIAHVRTQLPYAGLAATVAAVGFAVMGAAL